MHARNRALLASVAASFAASVAAAQTPSLGSPVSASGAFTGGDAMSRAALYTHSAFTAPQGRFGLTVQAIGSSSTIGEGGDELKVRGAGAAFSAFYGVTDAITLGAGLPYASMTSEISVGGISGEETVDGLGDAELFARMRAFRSASGGTQLALGAGMTLPTGDDAFSYDDPTYQVGGAMSHRVNRVSFHVAPDMYLVQDMDPSFDLNVAAAFAATPKLALSVESLNRFIGSVDGMDAERTRLLDVGAGLRYSAADNLLLDLGVRANVANNIEGVNTSSGGVTFGFNWLF